MKKLLIIIVLAGAGWHFYSQPGQITLGPGVQANEVPLQESIRSPSIHRLDSYKITELADFQIKAKVLSKKDYTFGREADLSPTDLALGWGNMSDERILDHISISQSS